MKLKVPYFKQERETNCGVACLRMVAAFHENEVCELERSVSDNMKACGNSPARGANMEIYKKVKQYLFENIGHMTTAGTPKYDVLKNLWRVPVLCKTERGIIVVGEFSLDKEGNFVNIPTKREMLKVAELEMERLPFLYYGTKKELTEQKSKPVAI